MVRVGGGWMALDEFLVKNDPCRGNFYNNFKSKLILFNIKVIREFQVFLIIKLSGRSLHGANG